MATSSSCVKTTEQIQSRREEREITSPGSKLKRRVPVVYYLSRNGHLDHPHFMEVPLSSPQGLFLTDVIERLNALRGKGMASMYSWSCKRRYKNGFVWHDLSENDFIHPAHFNDDYVLKGSELPPKNALPDLASPFNPPPPETQRSSDGSDLDHRRRRRHQSCSSVDFQYSVYKAEPSGGSAADASTQTDDNRLRRRKPAMVEEEENGEEPRRDESEIEVEIEISPPPSDSSPETLETLMKADRRAKANEGPANGRDGDRSRSSVLMQLISCGSISCGAGMGLGLIGQQYRMMVPRGGAERRRGELEAGEKEYFSGSLVEMKKDKLPAALKRSTSYNAHRNSSPHLEVGEREGEGVRAKCIPRKPKA